MTDMIQGPDGKPTVPLATVTVTIVLVRQGEDLSWGIGMEGFEDALKVSEHADIAVSNLLYTVAMGLAEKAKKAPVTDSIEPSEKLH